MAQVEIAVVDGRQMSCVYCGIAWELRDSRACVDGGLHDFGSDAETYVTVDRPVALAIEGYS